MDKDTFCKIKILRPETLRHLEIRDWNVMIFFLLQNGL